jgi:hypothetical protein
LGSSVKGFDDLVKLLSAFVSISMIFGCGIMSVIFGLPERYIEREMTPEEMVGTWNITSESETDVREFVAKFSDWDAYMPFTSLTLNGDGTCSGEYRANWLDEVASTDISIIHTTSCSWDLLKEENLSGKISPVVRLSFEYSNNSQGGGLALYVYEENDELIIWNFIGDPDDFRTQDFVRVK